VETLRVKGNISLVEEALDIKRLSFGLDVIPILLKPFTVRLYFIKVKSASIDYLLKVNNRFGGFKYRCLLVELINRVFDSHFLFFSN